MNIPWEALVTSFISLIGLISWLTKISVKQDLTFEKIKEIRDTVNVMEATYVKGVDFSRELGRVDNSISAAHKRIDELNLK